MPLKTAWAQCSGIAVTRSYYMQTDQGSGCANIHELDGEVDVNGSVVTFGSGVHAYTYGSSNYYTIYSASDTSEPVTVQATYFEGIGSRNIAIKFANPSGSEPTKLTNVNVNLHWFKSSQIMVGSTVAGNVTGIWLSGSSGDVTNGGTCHLHVGGSVSGDCVAYNYLSLDVDGSLFGTVRSYGNTTGALTFRGTSAHTGNIQADVSQDCSGQFSVADVNLPNAVFNGNICTSQLTAGSPTVPAAWQITFGTNAEVCCQSVASAPTVSNVTSNTANGAYKTGAVIDVRVQFSGTVYVTGTPRLLLETGTTNRWANYSSGSGSGVLAFSYTAQSGDTSNDLDYVSTTSLSLNGGTIKNSAGTNAVLTLPTPGQVHSLSYNKTIVIDTLPPTISIGSPSTSSVCAGGGSVSYTVTYTDAHLAAVTLNANHVTLNTTGDASGTISVSGSGTSSPATRTVTISDITGSGTIGISIAANTARDTANNYALSAGPSTTFTVQPATAITDHPEGGSAELGDTAIFSVEATGQGTLSYQWQKDESNLSNEGHYSGTTTDTLTVSDATWDDAGDYRCVVTGSCGSATSDDATLTVACHDPRQDAEGDGDVDLSDFSVFAQCFNGPNRPYAHANDECLCFDNESDDDVDLSDFFVFASCFNGPNRAPAAACSGGGFAMESMLGGESLLDSVDVTFALDSDQDGQTISAGTDVDWVASVEVTGSNQGLATFGFDVELHEGSATGPLADITLGTGTWADSFAVAGPNGQPETGAAVTASGSAGGPGMNALSSTGYNATEGLLEQVGAGYLNWDPWRQGGKSWTGNSTWGVGLDARKEALLLDEYGSYSLVTGTIDTSNLDPGDYVLRLVPAANIGVLTSGIDLNSPATGSVSEAAGSVSEPVTIEFTIGEE